MKSQFQLFHQTDNHTMQTRIIDAVKLNDRFGISIAGRTIVEKRKYEILLISFLLLMFGNSFYLPHFFYLVNIFFVCQNMLVGWAVFYRNKQLRITMGVLNILHFILVILNYYITSFDIRSWKGILYLLYFIIVSIEVYRKIFLTKEVSKEMIAAVLCGFILLCMIGTFLFNQIEVLHPHSFSNLASERNKLSDLNYFSCITILTIGYGDILPLTLVAKRAVMLMGLSGHFYTVFVTGIVIGKYISNK